MSAQKLEPFSAEISPTDALSEKLELFSLFGTSDASVLLSPIDRYLENSNRLNKIFLDNRRTFSNELGTLLLLGYVSAVESYLRGIIRGLVQVDECVSKLVGPLQVTYFAALHHDKALLPDALLEGVSFISQANISKTLKEFCGIGGMGDGSVPKSLEPVFQKYNQICQLRHCCVHRFGLLGADNARRLNLPAHYLDQPIALSPAAVEEISIILEKFVNSLNSYIYADVLQRSLFQSDTITSNPERKYTSVWNLDFIKDEPRFARYYDLFAITASEPTSPSLWEEYSRFKQWAENCISIDSNITQNKLSKGVARPKKPGKPEPVVVQSSSPTPADVERELSSEAFSALPQETADALASAGEE